MYYIYRQNNSGGKFIGPRRVIIDAMDMNHADRKALKLGLYFNELREANNDCPHCGYRWDIATKYDAVMIRIYC